jgi:hypothetical protein
LGHVGTKGGDPGTVDAGIFLNYRRKQAEWPTLRLRDRLIETFGTNRIFTDVDNIQPGQDFTKVLEAAVGTCRVLLAVIGQDWVDALDEGGRRRLEDPSDWVRVEIESALRRPKVLVIPVLIDGATMPRVDQLPGELAQLSTRQAVEITASGFDNQVTTLITTLQKIFDQPSVQTAETPRPTPAPPFPTVPIAPPRPVARPPIAFTDYPVLPEDLQWSGPVAGNVVVDRLHVAEKAWVKIGDPVVSVSSASGPVTLRSTYIGQIEALYYRNGQPLIPGRPLFALAVSGWLFRVNFRMPFDTGVLVTPGMPSKKLDATATASTLIVNVDNTGGRPVPWGASSLLYVPAGSHLISVVYQQQGSSFGAGSQIVKIRNGQRVAMSYEAPRAMGRGGKLRA